MGGDNGLEAKEGSNMQTPAVWLVLGPQPDVGTTAVAEALIGGFRLRGVPAVGVKPVDIGCPHAEDHDLRSLDGERLWAASDGALPPLVVAPYRFGPAADPVSAASAAGLSLTLHDVMATIEDAARFGGPVVVVGPPEADGPFTASGDAWDLGRATSARIVLVVDDANAGALAGLRHRAEREGLTVLAVARTKAPIANAMHLRPTDTGKEAAARLAPALPAL